MLEGWVKFYRKSLDHWLYSEDRPHTRREAFEDMLLLVNHAETNVLVNGDLVGCGKGQSVMTLKSWAKQFKWSVSKVRTFFNLLEREEMITTEGLRKTTRVTICNYAYYQNEQQRENNEKTTRKQRENNEITTNKNDKNENIEKNELYKSLLDLYFTWHEEKFGVIPKMDGANGKALKAIITYIRSIQKKNNLPATDEEVARGFETILRGWSRLDAFTQKKTRLIDINSNLQLIINTFKNGHAKRSAVADQELERLIEETFAAANNKD